MSLNLNNKIVMLEEVLPESKKLDNEGNLKKWKNHNIKSEYGSFSKFWNYYLVEFYLTKSIFNIQKWKLQTFCQLHQWFKSYIITISFLLNNGRFMNK